VKILVVDDHALVREGLRQVLRGVDDAVEVVQASTCAEAFSRAEEHNDLDLVLLDYHLPDKTGLDALLIFGKQHPELPVIMLSGSANHHIMRKVLSAGAAGFVTKSSHSDELLQAIKMVLNGDIYVPAELESQNAPAVVDAHVEKTSLTQRQELVLRGLLDGRSNREISELLNVSDETVKTHVAAILRHFSVQNRTQAVVAAARRGYRSNNPI
jgi:DNA-binding NarL/FixJ family response regulator